MEKQYIPDQMDWISDEEVERILKSLGPRKQKMLIVSTPMGFRSPFYRMIKR